MLSLSEAFKIVDKKRISVKAPKTIHFTIAEKSIDYSRGSCYNYVAYQTGWETDTIKIQIKHNDLAFPINTYASAVA